MNEVLMIVMAAGAVLGGFDRLRGNKWGFGDKFETGFMLLGSMALSMVGMICIAPVLAQWLGNVIVPLYRLIGVDPAMFGSLLSIDMGGYQLALELAEDPQLGNYAGLVVASIFGCTLVFTIPVGMGMIPKADRPFFAKGIMLGLVAMPVGLVGLWKIPNKMIKGFILLSEGIRWLVTISLALAAVESMTGFNPIPGMTPIADAMATVSSIAVVLLGSLPIAELVRRLLMRPFAWLGERLHMKPQSLTGMLISLVSSLPTLSMYEEMDNRGKVAVGAFVVSGTSLLAAHMAFTVSAEPTMLAPVLVAKLTGALAAAVLALCLKSGSAETGKAV